MRSAASTRTRNYMPSFIHLFIHSIAMCRIRRFLAVLSSFFHSSLLYILSFHPFPPINLPSSLTSSCHLFLGLPLTTLTHSLTTLTHSLTTLTHSLTTLTHSLTTMTHSLTTLTHSLTTLTPSLTTLTEVFPCFFLSFKANARVFTRKVGARSALLN